MKTVWARFTNNWGIIISILAAFVAVLPLLHAGLPPTHDGEYHVIRFYEFDRALRDGNIYPVWAPDLNFTYGVPLFNYVYPLPNYMASLFHALGASFIDAFKINMFIASIVGAIGMYLWSASYYGKKSGVVASIFYTFAPYHFLDIYIRGSVGEVWALGLFPLYLYLFTKGCKEKAKNYFIFAGITFALIIFSHNILAVMFAAFAISYLVLLLFQTKNKKLVTKASLFTFFIGGLLSAIFWFPALVEKQFVVGLNTSNISSNFPEIFQLLIPSWGSGFSGDSIEGQMSFQIGVANLFVLVVAIVTLFFKRVDKKSKEPVIFMLVWMGILIYMILPFSWPLWNLPLLDNFQFSWRLLSLVILVCAFLAGYTVSVIKNKFFAIALVIFVIVSTYSYAKPPYYLMRDDNHYTARANFIYGTNSPGDIFNTKWMRLKNKKPVERIIPQSKNTRVLPIFQSSTRYIYSINSDNRDLVKVNLAYFPGWQVIIDGKRVKTQVNRDGTFSFLTKKRKQSIEISFKGTSVRLFAKIVSLGGIILVALIFASRKKLIQ